MSPASNRCNQSIYVDALFNCSPVVLGIKSPRPGGGAKKKAVSVQGVKMPFWAFLSRLSPSLIVEPVAPLWITITSSAPECAEPG